MISIHDAIADAQDNNDLVRDESDPNREDIECLDLTDELFVRFERNDQDLVGLTVQSNGWIEGAGIAFSQSKFLRRLNIVLNSETQWFAELCAGIACNETIEELQLVFDVDGGGRLDAFRFLAPFLRNNPSLHSILIINCHPQSVGFEGPFATKLGSLSSALTGRKHSRLKKFSIEWNPSPSDEEMEVLFESLRSEHNNLKELTFNNITLQRMGSTALGNLLKTTSSKVRTLDLEHSHISSDSTAILCNAMTKMNTLQCLNLSEIEPPLSASSCLSISMVLKQPFSSLKTLRMSNNDIGDEGISILGDALAINTTLQYLDLDESRSITLSGWQSFSNCLRNPRSALKELILWRCEMDEQGAVVLASSLAANTSVMTLDLDHNAVGSAGLVAFFRALRDSASVLEILLINFVDLEDITEEEWCILSHALCDVATIGKTYTSNHTFHTCALSEDLKSWRDRSLQELCTLLDWNGNPNKAEVARQKIMQYHFSCGKSGIHAIACMHESVLPHAIEWLGRDKHGYSAMFSFVKSFPTIFDVSPEQHEGAKKRKIG